jgi:hypothetical protein
MGGGLNESPRPRDKAASVSATRRRMISATGRISFIAPAVCPADHYRLICHAKAEATSSAGRRIAAQPSPELAA